MDNSRHNRSLKRKREATGPIGVVNKRTNRVHNMTTEQASTRVSAEEFQRKVLEALTKLPEVQTELQALRAEVGQQGTELQAVRAAVGQQGSELQALRADMEGLRDFQVDQERERHTLLLSGSVAGRGALPAREPNLTISGARFKTTKKDYKPASIY
ncbi:MAG: hypothetical protein JWQ07_97 [Ramlibacter sp.]|nr:hypothetical protein [Ramlibacter sp.]